MVLHEQGKVEESRPYTTEVIALRKQAAQRADAGASKLNEYAWVLLTCKPEDLRDPETALPVAMRAVEKSEGKDPLVLDTLALAYFMTGEVYRALGGRLGGRLNRVLLGIGGIDLDFDFDFQLLTNICEAFWLE